MSSQTNVNKSKLIKPRSSSLWRAPSDAALMVESLREWVDVNGRRGKNWQSISLTMSAGVLPVMVKVFPVLGGVHADTNTRARTHTRDKHTNIPSRRLPLLIALTRLVVCRADSRKQTIYYSRWLAASPQSQHWGSRDALQPLLPALSLIAQPCRWSFPRTDRRIRTYS